ncbi:MAG: hypothetical protein JO164_08710 [Candidatus Eremiobacteraeota bacterium]|nr:hypothetical protein [Candidatus Eremiobacteraeota bacterium]
MNSVHRSVIALSAAAALSACGGGGGSVGSSAPSALPPVTPQSSGVTWIAALRYVPTQITLSLSSPSPQYMYIDSGATNGAYPSPSAFQSEIQSANPGLQSGACAAFTHMTGAIIQFTDAFGNQAPSYVVMFAPTAKGTCTQQVNLGAEGVQNFTVTVAP